MQEKVQARLAELRLEHQKGQEMLQNLQRQQLEMEQTLLRIAGAIQVLEELGTEPGNEAGD